MGGSGGAGGRTPTTTVPPPFDPEEYARDSELAMRVAAPASDLHRTAEMPPAPPLNKRVRLNVPLSDLAWFELGEGALQLAEKLDGTRSISEVMELLPGVDLQAVGQLHDAGVLVYED
jgi:hypothetical protein